jgi:hypothetical protein
MSLLQGKTTDFGHAGPPQRRPVSRLFALCPRPPDGLEQYPIVKGFLEESHNSGRRRFSAGLLIFVDSDEHDGHTLTAISQHLQEFHANHHCYPVGYFINEKLPVNTPACQSRSAARRASFGGLSSPRQKREPAQ